jgi:hypothetical protein
MLMVVYTTSKTDKELLQILELQQSNLAVNLTHAQITSQGFVTVTHSFDVLKKMNDIEQSIIAKDHDRVVGYLLAMTKHSKLTIPVLIPMFAAFDKLKYRNKKISDYNYILVGQACVAEDYRGQGVFDNCYTEYKKYFKEKYDFAITEISKKNKRSINAHKRVGFDTIHEYIDPDGENWNIVLWDWKNKP